MGPGRYLPAAADHVGDGGEVGLRRPPLIARRGGGRNDLGLSERPSAARRRSAPDPARQSFARQEARRRRPAQADEHEAPRAREPLGRRYAGRVGLDGRREQSDPFERASTPCGTTRSGRAGNGPRRISPSRQRPCPPRAQRPLDVRRARAARSAGGRSRSGRKSGKVAPRALVVGQAPALAIGNGKAGIEAARP